MRRGAIPWRPRQAFSSPYLPLGCRANKLSTSSAPLLTIFSVAIFWSAACWKELRGRTPRQLPLSMLLGMGVLSAATMVIGLMPGWIDALAKLSAAALARMGMFA